IAKTGTPEQSRAIEAEWQRGTAVTYTPTDRRRPVSGRNTMADGTSRFGRLRPPQGEGFSPPPHPRTAMVEQLDEKGPTGWVPVGQAVYAGLNLIGTQRVAGRGPQTRRIVNPADTAELVAAVQEASPEQVEEVCAVAARAFPAWQVTPPPDRARVLFRYREL